MIELRDVALSYADRTLFQGVTLTLRHGEIALIRGRSGCGKTSLLRLISRFLLPTRGSLHLEQRPYEEFRYEELRTRVVYIHQSPVMEDKLSVLENLLLPFSYGVHKKKKRPEDEEIQRLCATFHLGPEALNREAGSLSVGERQRFAASAIGEWIARQTLASTGLVIASHQPVEGLPNEKVRVLEIAGGRLHERRH